MSTHPHNVGLEPLVVTCREISRLLAQVKPSPTLRTFAPGLVDAIPLLKALALGIEDLADRVTLIEAGGRLSSGGPALALEQTGTHQRSPG